MTRVWTSTPDPAVRASRARPVMGAFAAVLSMHVAATAMPAPPDAAPAEGSCGGEVITAQAARDAVDFVARSVADAHVDGPDRDAQTLQGLRVLRESIRGPAIPASLALSINRELAHSGDAHLRLDLPADAAGRCRSLPFEFEWTDRGLLVATEGGPVPAGSRISALGQRSLEQIEMLAGQVIPNENPYWARSEFARLAAREDWARAVELSDVDGALDLSYVTPTGESRRTTVAFDRPSAAIRPWVGFQLFPEHSTGHFWMDRCDLDDEFMRTLDEFVVAVRKAGVRKVAIDLRRNPGGDAGAALAVLRAFGATVSRGFGVEIRVSDMLLAAMPMFAPAAIAPAFVGAGLPPPAADAVRYQLPAPLVLAQVQSRLGDRAFETATGREIYLLTGGATFSSAALFTLLVRDDALGLIVGEPIGNSASFNGSEVILPVPGIPHELHVSTARLSRPEPLSGNPPTILPDVLAPSTPHSIAQQTDPALDYVRHARVPGQRNSGGTTARRPASRRVPD